MTVKPLPSDLSELLATVDTESFSRFVLGAPYEQVQKQIYPRRRYKSFFIRKRSGALRLIQEPRKALKELQLRTLAYLSARAGEVKPCVHGFVKKRSVVTNAAKHCNKKTHHILNIDLQDFFPSITFYRVRGALQATPFNLSYRVATVVAHLCTMNGVLPQGAPTSPFLSNLICRRLDRDLMALAKRHNATYTRYADDITFSFSARSSASLPKNICTFDSGVVLLGKELIGLIEANGFRVNPDKTRISSKRHRMEVTGVTINRFPNVKRSFLDAIRGALHGWDIYGYEKAQREWMRRCSHQDGKGWARQTRHRTPPELKRYLRGKLLYLRMVRGADDTTYARLAEKFNQLCDREARVSQFEYTALPVKPVVLSRDDARRAVFVIEWSGDYEDDRGNRHFVGGQGTAFLYRGLGLVTCEHILNSTVTIEGRTIDVSSSSPRVEIDEFTAKDESGKAWRVAVEHRDAHRDLALLRFVGEQPAFRYFVPTEAPIPTYETGWLLGFPNWSPGRPANIAEAKVLSTFPRHGLQRFEISLNIRQGNSGGPFTDSRFRLAGVAQRGSSQTSGNDECLMAHELDAWLSSIDPP